MKVLLEKPDYTDTFNMETDVFLKCPNCEEEYEWCYPRTQVDFNKFKLPKPQEVCPACQAKYRINENTNKSN